MGEQKFIEISKSFFVDCEYEKAFAKLGLTSIDAVFSFNAGKNLFKDNLAAYRSRLQFEIDSPPVTFFLKRYLTAPIPAQLKNWLSRRSRVSIGFSELEAAKDLAAVGVSTPKIISYGEQWGRLFEKRSFLVTEKIPDAESLERKLPDYFDAAATVENLKLRRAFIAKLAAFVRKFHETNYRHRDLYFSHIFYGSGGGFYLIDLARAFKPMVTSERFRIKDIAQLHYSAPKQYFSRTDRLRFYHLLTGHSRLSKKDETFIGKVQKRAKRMAKHDIKHGRAVGFAG